MDPLPFVRQLGLAPEWESSESTYPFTIPAVRQLDGLRFSKTVTVLVGENGSGKSTILEALAVALGFNAEGGSKNFQFSTRESHSGLHDHLRVMRSHQAPRDGFFLRAESFFNVATNIEALDEEPFGGPRVIDSFGGVSLHEQSHGESFLALLMDRFGGEGLYILDEPEAALSPTRQLAVLSRLHQLVREHSQFIIATHSPILMAYPGALIYNLDERGIEQIDYEETEHFQVTRAFLNHPERMLRELFREVD